ncbi:hypothetical protein N7463_010445 [Penicillium fimorum]|uniref:Uncharacterized protein n=1 Tax=Penicillium fimorum TaxID=1882269 RepID=A0A9W9XJX8_9EURO|nr:hypothetical protein N7463_010445 [Penicillium fimorum]
MGIEPMVLVILHRGIMKATGCHRSRTKHLTQQCVYTGETGDIFKVRLTGLSHHPFELLVGLINSMEM